MAAEVKGWILLKLFNDMKRLQKFFLFAAILLSCQTQKKESLVHLANQYAKDGLLRESITIYKKVLKKEPDNYIAYRNLGFVFVKAANYKSAIRYLVKSMPYFENDFDSNFYLAEAYRARSRFADAIFYYQKSLKINPTALKVKKALSWSYFRIRYYSEALKMAKQLLRADPNDVQAALILARTQVKLEKYKAAEKTLRSSLEEARGEDLAYLQSVQGDLQFARGNIRAAAILYKKAIRGQPMLAGALLGLGKCLVEVEKHKSGIKYMERALRVRPDLSETHLLLGQAYEKINVSRSIYHYQKFRKKASSDPEFLSRMAHVSKRISFLRKWKRTQKPKVSFQPSGN